MTRLDLLILQMRRADEKGGLLSDAWLFFWLLYKRETQVFEVASRSYLPMWERYQLEEACAMNLSERALEVMGPRNEDPDGAEPGTCYSVGGDNPYCGWHNEEPPTQTQAPCQCKGCTGSPGW